MSNLWKQEILINNNLLFHPFSNDFLGLSFTVGVGGVDEVSSELHESVQDLKAGFFVQFGTGPELENRSNIFGYSYSAFLIDHGKNNLQVICGSSFAHSFHFFRARSKRIINILQEYILP